MTTTRNYDRKMIDRKMSEGFAHPMFLSAIFLSELCASARIRIDPAHEYPKSVPKWDESCHTCNFAAEFGGRRSTLSVPNGAKPVPFSVKPVPKVPNLAPCQDFFAHGISVFIPSQPHARARDKVAYASGNDVPVAEKHAGRARVIDSPENARFNVVLVELALNAAQGSL
jgi:hypothetical protein